MYKHEHVNIARDPFINKCIWWDIQQLPAGPSLGGGTRPRDVFESCILYPTYPCILVSLHLHPFIPASCMLYVGSCFLDVECGACCTILPSTPVPRILGVPRSDLEIRSRSRPKPASQQPAASSQQPASLQPAGRSQEPAASSQQPAANSQD